MDKDKVILSIIMTTLVSGHEYKPSQLEAMMGDKYDSFKDYFKCFSEKQYEKELVKLFNEYLSIV